MDTLVARARALAESRLADLSTRLEHVRGVASAAEAAVAALGVEEADTVVAAAWLHDIGYAESVKRTGFHPVDGAEFAEREGFPAPVVSLVAYHTGAVVEAAERGLSEELARFARPDFNDLDLLTYADMTTGPDGSAVDADARVEEILHRYGPGEVVHRAVSHSAPDLLAAVARVEGRLAAVSQPR